MQKQIPLKKTLRISAIFQSIIGKTFSIQKNQGAIMKEVGKDLIVLIINTKLHLNWQMIIWITKQAIEDKNQIA